jgi:hypothetical protein
MMTNVPHLIPPKVRQYLKTVERQQERAQQQRTAKICKLIAAGKRDEAIELMVGDRCPVPSRVQDMVDAMPPEPKRTGDRPKVMTMLRQRKIVEILTSGNRCSINRAWKLAGYGNHQQSLDQLLSSPAVLDLFQQAVDQGRPLPLRYETRIRAAIEERGLGIR